MRNLMLIAASALALGLPACDRGGVNDELTDLKEAQQNVGTRVQELEKDLEQAKSNVVRLEEELALAKEGITDEVIEEREELKAALKNQEKEVEEHVASAEKSAKSHDVESDKARQALNDTAPPEVKAEVDTETEVTESERQPVRGEETEEKIEVEKNYWDKETEKAPAESSPESAEENTQEKTEENAPKNP